MGADVQARRRLRLAFAWSILVHLLAIGMLQPPRLPETPRSFIVFIRPAGRVGVEGPAVPVAGSASRREQGPGQRPPLLSLSKGSTPPAPVAAPAESASDRPVPGELTRAPAVDSDGREDQLGELDADGLRRYRVSLGGAMAGFKAYPVLAQQRGWQGRVELLLRVVRGRAPRAMVEKSSGFPVLDSRARDMLQQAASVTPLPPSLGSRDFALPLTVVFDLEDP